MKKYKMVCSHCGSEDVRADAYVEWDSDAQDWSVSCVFDKGSICESDECQGGETTIEQVEIEDNCFHACRRRSP